MIDYSKILRFIRNRDAAAKMCINDTFYVVRSGDHYLSAHQSVFDKKNGTLRSASLLERLCDNKSEAERYGSWADAEAVARKLQVELETVYDTPSIRFVAATVERVDDRPTIADVVARWELYFIDGSTREDGIDRIASHFFGKEDVPAYVTECMPQIIDYFRTAAAANEAWDEFSDAEFETFNDYQSRLSAAKKAVADIEIELLKAADANGMQLC